MNECHVIKSKIGNLGFERLNYFTNDEIVCSGFSPDGKEIKKIGSFIKETSYLFFSDVPINLYITKKNDEYIADIKILDDSYPVFAISRSSQLDQLISNLKNEIIFQSIESTSQYFNGEMHSIQ